MYYNNSNVPEVITKRLRRTHAAWHFWYAVSFGGESGLRKVGLCGIRPLTRRYVTVEKKTTMY
nr:DUF3265 domain-containing protein [Vibrio cincinnatiensis]